MTNTESTPAYTHRFWAKSEPREGYPKRIHLLEHHLADVGACFEALLDQPTIRRRLAVTGGLDDLDETLVARLCVLAALHDIGKVNVGFQTQIWQETDLPTGRRPAAFRRVGHYNELVPVLNGDDNATTRKFFDSGGWWWDAIESWDDRDGETVCALFIAALSHHGQPLQLEGNLSHNSRLWSSYGSLDPVEGIRRIGGLVRQWFPAAFAADGPTLPTSPEFQHMFLGLCTLADWIGSNEDWFKFVDKPDDGYMDSTARRKARDAVEAIGLDLSKQRAAVPRASEFNGLFPHIEGQPNAIQQAAAETAPEEPLVIIESETGSGKTEAALWRFARMYEAGLVDGLYFALPTRAAARQLHERVTRFVKRMFPDGAGPEPVLAVPGYVKAGDIGGHHLQSYEVWWDDRPGDAARSRRWAAEGAKRYLAAQIAVGTVDQAMMAALKVKHAHMRTACLARNLLVVDEVHASDTYMRRILKALLDAHLGAGGYALLMSATLGSAARQEWLSAGRLNAADVIPMREAIQSPYPAVSTTAPGGGSVTVVAGNDQEKSVHIRAEPWMHDADAVAARAMRAARARAKVLVIRNTVNHAIGTQQALETASANDKDLLFACGDIPTLHHGRFAADDRRLLDSQVENRLGRERGPGGLVVVGTQTLEQSLDIDADLLITDLCPMDVLLQRIGRLHRHSRGDRPPRYDTPTCIVLTPESEDLSPLLTRGANRNGLGPYGHVYEDLRILEATRRLVVGHSRWSIPRMNRELVEKATHPDAMEDIVKELGDDWRVHALSIEGGQIAEGLTAANVVIRRDKSFFGDDNRDVLFPSGAEEKIRTRLGDEGIEVELDPPPRSPFDPGRRIERMTVPEHLLRGAFADGPILPNAFDGGFTFAVGKRAFRYDRLGLRRES